MKHISEVTPRSPRTRAGDTSITKAALWERLGHYRPHTEVKTVNHLAGSGSMTLDKVRAHMILQAVFDREVV